MFAFSAPSPSRQNASRVAPRLVAIVATLTIAIALTAAAFAAPANAAACKPPAIAWKFNGKSICLKTAKLPKSTSHNDAKSSLASWMKTISKPALPVKGARSKLKLPAKLRRAVPKATSVATNRFVDAPTPSFKTAARRAKRSIGVASENPVVARQALKSETKTLPSGATVKSWGELVQRADGSIYANAHVDLEVDGYTLRYQPHLDDPKGLTIPQVECPTASGYLRTEHSSKTGGTMIVLKGRNAIGSRTMVVTKSFAAEGHVGRDAKLASVKASSTLDIRIYERGFQYQAVLSGNSTATREGDPTISGTPTARVKIRSASMSKAQERAAEAEMSRKEAVDPATGSALARGADLGRWRMMRDEYKWYDLPNYCARATLTPNYPKLDEGESLAVSGSVSAASGGEAAGSFGTPSVSRGSFGATKSEFDPGAPAKFTAVGAQPHSDNNTVAASVIASSTAGRAQVEFGAEADEIKVPQSFGGWVESETIDNGLRYRFDAFLNFELTYKNTGPGGFATAWYELTSIFELQESVNSFGIHGGCRLEAKANMGAVINSGDIELRRQSAGSGWTFALHVDFSIPDQQFKETDCPPDTELPEFTADIVNYLYTAPGGSPFRPIWSGSTATDMRLIDSGQSNVTGPGLSPTTASWGLTGTF